LRYGAGKLIGRLRREAMCARVQWNNIAINAYIPIVPQSQMARTKPT